MSVRPTFINIGPGRCGTSWLFEVLAAHPQVGMSKVKETEFFNTNYDRGKDWYESHFAHLESRDAVGEVSNNYYLDRTVAERIRDYRADMKIIANIRDPVSLVASIYEFGKRRGLDLPPLKDALHVPVGRFMGSGFDYRQERNKLTATDKVPLLDSVRLKDLMQAYTEVFPAEQVYFFVYERFRQEPLVVLREIDTFLGVDPSFQPKLGSSVVNESIQPKSQWLARLGSRFAFLLRRIGAYGMLSALHRSRLVKRVFFRRTHRSGRQATDIVAQLNPETVADLQLEREKIAKMVPSFGDNLAR